MSGKAAAAYRITAIDPTAAEFSLHAGDPIRPATNPPLPLLSTNRGITTIRQVESARSIGAAPTAPSARDPVPGTDPKIRPHSKSVSST